MTALPSPSLLKLLRHGMVIPASPLALTAQRKLDPLYQRALWRYYSAAGAGGIAVAVHTTQFAIRNAQYGLFEPLLQFAQREFDQLDKTRRDPLLRVAGVCGQTSQAVAEAETAAGLGFHTGLLNLGAMKDADDQSLIDHCRAVARHIAVFGFYLHPGVGGRELSYAFWRRFLEIDNVIAIKIAAFNRYQTLDVMRAVVESGRDDVALYTGNDDNIVADLITPYRFKIDGRQVERRFVGGLLGHWAVWTHRAVELLQRCLHAVRENDSAAINQLLHTNIEVTDMNAAIFDPAHQYTGCIPGIHHVLCQQGLLQHEICLDPGEKLSPGQAQEIDRIRTAYPHLTDDPFITQNISNWLTE